MPGRVNGNVDIVFKGYLFYVLTGFGVDVLFFPTGTCFFFIGEPLKGAKAIFCGIFKGRQN
jgi:hypothetical protein